MNQASDIRKAFLSSVLAVVLFCLWLSGELKYLKEHWRIVVYGKLLSDSALTNLEGFGLLLLALFMSALMLSLLTIRRCGLRQTGDMLAQQQKEIRAGLSGVDELSRVAR
jgi:hypothetical protein